MVEEVKVGVVVEVMEAAAAAAAAATGYTDVLSLLCCPYWGSVGRVGRADSGASPPPGHAPMRSSDVLRRPERWSVSCRPHDNAQSVVVSAAWRH